MNKLKKFKNIHNIRLSISDLEKIEPRFEQLESIFQKIPASTAIFLLSNIAVSYEINSDRTERYLRNGLLSPELRKALEVLESDGRKFAIFGEMSLLLLINTCRTHSPSEPSESMTFGEAGYQIARAFLIANHFINAAQPDISESNKYALFAMRETIFNERDQFRYMLARSAIIFSEFASKSRNPELFDVAAFLKQHYGFELHRYWSTILAVYTHWSQQSDPESVDPNKSFIHLEQFFPKESNPELIRILKSITQEWRDLTPGISVSDRSQVTTETLYSNFTTKQKPLVDIEDRIFPMSFKFLKDLIWNGPYYLVIDKLRELSHSPDHFFHSLGQATEFYFKRLFQFSFPRLFTTAQTDKGNPVGDFILRINPRFHVVVEVKAKRPNIDAILGRKTLAKNQAVRMMFTEPLQQLDDRIAEHRESFNGRITPVLITLGSLGINEFTWPFYKELVPQIRFLNDPKCDPPIFLDAETAEILCAIGKNGGSLSEVIRNKTSNTWKHDDFKSFLIYDYLSDRREPVNHLLVDVTASVFADLKNELFGISESVVPAWTEVFYPATDENEE